LLTSRRSTYDDDYLDVPKSSDEDSVSYSLKGRKSPFGGRKKRATADNKSGTGKKRSKPIQSKLALLKKNKKSKKSNNFDVEIMVSRSSRPTEDESSRTNVKYN